MSFPFRAVVTAVSSGPEGARSFAEPSCGRPAPRTRRFGSAPASDSSVAATSLPRSRHRPPAKPSLVIRRTRKNRPCDKPLELLGFEERLRVES